MKVISAWHCSMPLIASMIWLPNYNFIFPTSFKLLHKFKTDKTFNFLIHSEKTFPLHFPKHFHNALALETVSKYNWQFHYQSDKAHHCNASFQVCKQIKSNLLIIIRVCLSFYNLHSFELWILFWRKKKRFRNEFSEFFSASFFF